MELLQRLKQTEITVLWILSVSMFMSFFLTRGIAFHSFSVTSWYGLSRQIPSTI